jgi:hypothetical protein
MGRDHIIRVCLQPLSEQSAPSPIVWAYLRFILTLHLSFLLSDLFVEVNHVPLNQGYKGCVRERGFSSFSPHIQLPQHPLGHLL